MVIIALCVFFEAILGAAMPSKEARGRVERRRITGHTMKLIESLYSQRERTSTAVNADHSVMLMSTTKM